MVTIVEWPLLLFLMCVPHLPRRPLPTKYGDGRSRQFTNTYFLLVAVGAGAGTHCQALSNEDYLTKTYPFVFVV